MSAVRFPRDLAAEYDAELKRLQALSNRAPPHIFEQQLSIVREIRRALFLAVTGQQAPDDAQ